MNFSLKPHHLIAHWVPGFMVSTATACLALLLLHKPIGTVAMPGLLFLLIVAGVIAGQIIDAMRMAWLENASWWNARTGRVDWDFFFKTERQRLQNLDEFYYVYYEFDLNLLIGIALILVLSTCALMEVVVTHGVPYTLSYLANIPRPVRHIAVLLVVFSLFAIPTLWRDAEGTRREIARLTRPQSSPHDGVFTRLQPSKVHAGGIGVFAVVDIPQGTSLFGEDDTELVPTDAANLLCLKPEIRRLYEDFCVITQKGKHYDCPLSFNAMTVSWYLNHSDQPNVQADATARFFAKRDIAKGEELTVDYGTYNEWDVKPNYMA